MEKVFICDVENEKMFLDCLHGFWADKAQWRFDPGWPKPAYRVTVQDEAALRGLILYVKATSNIIVLD